MSQKNLRRAGQVPAMVEALMRGEVLPRITLVRSDDGEIQVHDGHHRLSAYWLAGRRTLARHEYLLLEQEQYPRPRRGKVEDLLRRVREGRPQQAAFISRPVSSSAAPRTP
jgi:hypothetical protein